MFKDARSFALIAILVGIFWLGSFAMRDTYSADSKTRTKWEYLAVGTHSEQNSATVHVNQFGKDGWELVAVDASLCFFKRPMK